MPHSQSTDIGILYIVATPIGNLQDISTRAIETLKSVDFILAEDTRHSKQLLNALGINNKLISLHAHNENEKSQQIIDFILAGQSIALISDAGTPLISDPGYPLVHLAHQHNIQVIPIPGSCALVTALSASGVATDSFLFIGFLPAKQAAREAKLKSLQNQSHTLIFYESTHRIIPCFQSLIEVFGTDCPVVLAKELTKSYEKILPGTMQTILNWLREESGHEKGEFVIIIPPRKVDLDNEKDEMVLKILLEELPLKQAVHLSCKLTGGSKNDLYSKALLLLKKL